MSDRIKHGGLQHLLQSLLQVLRPPPQPRAPGGGHLVVEVMMEMVMELVMVVVMG